MHAVREGPGTPWDSMGMPIWHVWPKLGANELEKSSGRGNSGPSPTAWAGSYQACVLHSAPSQHPVLLEPFPGEILSLQHSPARCFGCLMEWWRGRWEQRLGLPPPRLWSGWHCCPKASPDAIVLFCKVNGTLSKQLEIADLVSLVTVKTVSQDG